MFAAVNVDRATVLTSCVVFVAVNVERATYNLSVMFADVNVDRATVLISCVVFVAVNVDSLNTPPTYPIDELRQVNCYIYVEGKGFKSSIDKNGAV